MVVFVIVVFRRLIQQLVRSALRLFLGSVGRLLRDALSAPATVMLLFPVVLVRFLSRVRFALPCVPGLVFVGAIVLHIFRLVGGCHIAVFLARLAFQPVKKMSILIFTRPDFIVTYKELLLRFLNGCEFSRGSSAAEEISSSSFLLSSGSIDSS